MAWSCLIYSVNSRLSSRLKILTSAPLGIGLGSGTTSGYSGGGWGESRLVGGYVSFRCIIESSYLVSFNLMILTE